MKVATISWRRWKPVGCMQRTTPAPVESTVEGDCAPSWTIAIGALEALSAASWMTQIVNEGDKRTRKETYDNPIIRRSPPVDPSVAPPKNGRAKWNSRSVKRAMDEVEHNYKESRRSIVCSSIRPAPTKRDGEPLAFWFQLMSPTSTIDPWSSTEVITVVDW
jgi:hypothetical protein